MSALYEWQLGSVFIIAIAIALVLLTLKKVIALIGILMSVHYMIPFIPITLVMIFFTNQIWGATFWTSDSVRREIKQ